jgi:hypothetical protein
MLLNCPSKSLFFKRVYKGWLKSHLTLLFNMVPSLPSDFCATLYFKRFSDIARGLIRLGIDRIIHEYMNVKVCEMRFFFFFLQSYHWKVTESIDSLILKASPFQHNV